VAIVGSSSALHEEQLSGYSKKNDNNHADDNDNQVDDYKDNCICGDELHSGSPDFLFHFGV